jgi:RNA recognition motif-containing protein
MAIQNKLYVGNLLYEVTDADLNELFSPYGEVESAEVVRYRKSKRSKGYGFVVFTSPDSANAALEALNNTDYRGRKLMLAIAKAEKFDESTAPTRSERSGRNNRDNGDQSAITDDQNYTQLVATPLPQELREDRVRVEESTSDPSIEQFIGSDPMMQSTSPAEAEATPVEQPQEPKKSGFNFGTIFRRDGKDDSQ